MPLKVFMNKDKTITCYEHETLYFDGAELDSTYYKALVRYNDLHGQKYFDVGLNKIKFKSYVGVIQAGNKIIEVLPKADRESESKASTKNKWQGALLFMLNKAGYVKLNETEKASQKTRNTNLLDIYLYIFLKEVEQLIHSGLVKKYRAESKNETVLKGRLIIEKQITLNNVHKERFFTVHTIYDRNNVLNQILYTALQIVAKTTTNRTIKHEAAKNLLFFEGIDNWLGFSLDLDKIKLDRKTKSYEYALELCKMIILNYSPDMKSGTKKVLALLFDMNQLFEKFIYRMLKAEEVNFISHNLQISRQSSQVFWGHKTIRPDIIITYSIDNMTAQSRVIVDTKWKIVDFDNPSDSDLKQMYTYNLQFDAKHSVLLYPFIDQQNIGFREYGISMRNFDFSHSCEMYFIDLFEEDKISSSFGNKFIKYLLEIGN